MIMMSRSTLTDRVAARRLWRAGWTIGAVTAAALAMMGLDARTHIGNLAWIVVLGLVAVAAGGLALSWRSPLYGGMVVLIAGCCLVPVVITSAAGDRRLALAMVSLPFVVAGALILSAVWLVREGR